jgi:hypothetical protein
MASRPNEYVHTALCSRCCDVLRCCVLSKQDCVRVSCCTKNGCAKAQIFDDGSLRGWARRKTRGNPKEN